MRVLFTSIAATGHFHPLVPIARALQQAGHGVRFASAPSMAGQVAASGFPFVPAGIDFRALDVELPELRTLSPLARRDVLRRRAFPEVFPTHLLPDLLAIGGTWPPDLVVRDNGELAGCVAAEHWRIPHAAVHVARGDRYDQRCTLAPALDALRATVGLPSDPGAAMPYRYLYLVCEPPRLQPPGEAFPPTTHRLRRVIFDRSGDEKLPNWVSALPDRPVALATLGTAYNRHTEVFALLLAALRDEPITLIVTVGRNLDPAQFGPQPASVHVERYIPQSLLFPHCDLVVSHCGAGTMFAALEHGLPLVNIPIAADQPENAAQCAALRLGITVGPEERTAEAIRAAVREVLTNPSYRRAAEEVRDEMAVLPGPERAVELLERLAIERRPLVTG